MIKQIISFFQKPQPETPLTWVLFITLLAAVFCLSAGVRYNQLNTWKTLYEQTFFTNGTPMMTTLDAYKFLRHAKEYEAGTFNPSVKDKMIFYPDDSPFPNPVPLLSVITNKISKIIDKSLYLTALDIVPIISSIFVIPLAIYFFLLGYPAAGLLGGIIGTFAPMFFMRTSMGRFDTDGGNLFFLFTASLFVLLAAKSKTRTKIWLYSGLLGITIMFFYMWYHHGMFNLFYFVLLVICLAFAKVKIKDIVIASIIYLVFTNPFYTANAFQQLFHALNIYIFNVRDGVSAIFPNVYETIGEAKKDPWLDVLRNVIPNPYIAILGLFGCILLVICHFKAMLPLAPIAALGALTFISAGRFSMFIGPFAGVGLGYLCVFGVSLIKLHSEKIKRLVASCVPFILAILTALGINLTGNSGASIIMPPSIQTKTFQAIKDIKNHLPPNSAIYSWWDYGLAIADAAGFPVFHSGMTQETPKTWIIAKSFTSNQQALHNIVSYLDNYGIAEVYYLAEDNKTLKEIEDRIFNYDEGPSNPNIYITITNDMMEKLGAIAHLAFWEDNTSAEQFLLQRLRCQGSNVYKLNCQGMDLDIKLGLINTNLPIKKAVVLQNGKVEENFSHNFPKGYYVVIDKNSGVYLMSESAFNSSFIQLYMLNKPDEKLFETAIDNYPALRMFKVLKKEETKN